MNWRCHSRRSAIRSETAPCTKSRSYKELQDDGWMDAETARRLLWEEPAGQVPAEVARMTIKFFPNDKGSPAGKVADAELHFSGGPLDGLKLVGFSVWERKGGGRNVTFPARQ